MPSLKRPSGVKVLIVFKIYVNLYYLLILKIENTNVVK